MDRRDNRTIVHQHGPGHADMLTGNAFCPVSLLPRLCSHICVSNNFKERFDRESVESIRMKFERTEESYNECLTF